MLPAAVVLLAPASVAALALAVHPAGLLLTTVGDETVAEPPAHVAFPGVAALDALWVGAAAANVTCPAVVETETAEVADPAYVVLPGVALAVALVVSAAPANVVLPTAVALPLAVGAGAANVTAPALDAMLTCGVAVPANVAFPAAPCDAPASPTADAA